MSTEPDHNLKGECSACGTAPINHKLHLFMDVTDSVFNKISDVMFGWAGNLTREGKVSNTLFAGIIGFFHLIGVAKFSDDPEKSVSDRSRLIWDEAILRNIKMQQIVIAGKPLEQYRAKINGRWIYFQSIPVPYWLPQEGYDWIDDKFKLAEKLNKNGINAPKALAFRSLKKAEEHFDEFKKPVIVKPRSGSRGRHTTTNIQNLDELREAYKIGKQIAVNLLMEEHLFGGVCRATVINNKLVGFYQAFPPRITGDGIHTVKELIDLKNETRNPRIGFVDVNDDLISFVKRMGYGLNDVVKKDEVLDLSAKTGRLYGGYTREIFPQIHPKLHPIFEKAGKIVQTSVVGFDVIMEDPMKDPDQQIWGIIECNSMPYIDLHYFAFEGEKLNLAKNVWDLWETEPH